MQSGEALQGIEDATDAEESGIVRKRGIIHDGVSATVVERLQGEGVTVEGVAFECEKEAAGRHASAVGRDGWVTQKEGVKVLKGHIWNGITKKRKVKTPRGVGQVCRVHVREATMAIPTAQGKARNYL